MHLSSTKQHLMNKTYTVLSNKYCSSYNDDEQDQSICIMENNSQLSRTLDKNRFSTFTKYKIKQHQTTLSVNQDQKRYFDSPTMITLDDDDDNDIPLIRCSNKRSNNTNSKLSLNETELSDLLIFTNPNRILTESMHVVVSRHPSLQDFKYINDVSSVLVESSDKPEPIYQELIRIDHLISTPPTDHINDIDENKENRPPLMPIKCSKSRIPIRTPSTSKTNMNTPELVASTKKKNQGMKQQSATKSCLSDLLDEWSYMGPKMKELLSNTRKLPLRIPDLTTHSIEFRRLKQLLNDLEVTTSSWTNAINQCRYVLQHAQQQMHRS
ncbi:unnamed protein product [Rotaria magnacalcarata]|uniref:Uncharacterized protein n=2 Tax=Rotaria magnacalcarata TaxID=392030 RepID=A0A816MFP0_9BILA|nr:unnamed protein product [Rotaria magnacalcarata]CAF3797496.1 unnamed protein product [Rotaria magnacalcarata]